jgi:hypothetical protein
MRESFDLAGYPLLTNIMAPAALPLRRDGLAIDEKPAAEYAPLAVALL